MTDAHFGLAAIEAALAAGETTCEALVARCMQRIEADNPRINAVLAVDGEGALAAARAADQRRQSRQALSPIDGIPFGVKDNINVAGFVTTGGLGGSPKQPAHEDAPAVARLRSAGAVPLAKLNLHEGALGVTSHNIHHGHCYNPLKPGFSPGGSSGGSAAAVAAGFVPFALGTDSMGSVRIPAACCGVVGLKASRGRISTDGTVVVSRRLDHVGPIAAALSDMETLLPLLDSHAPNGSRPETPPPEDPSAPVSPRLRFRYPMQLAELGVQSDIASAFAALIDTLKEAGHELQPVDLGHLDLGAFRRAGLLVCEADMLTVSSAWFDADPDALSAELAALLDWARGKSDQDLARANSLLDQGACEMMTLLADVDAWLSPTTPLLAPAMDETPPTGMADLTALANMAGVPALSLPMPLAGADLPAGLQIAGHEGSDYRLLKTARQIVVDSRGLISEFPDFFFRAGMTVSGIAVQADRGFPSINFNYLRRYLP